MNFYLTAQHTTHIVRIVMKLQSTHTPTGAGDSAAHDYETITLPISVVRDLLRESQELVDFAETYGPSERASVLDWSDYLGMTQAAIDAVKREASPIRKTRRAA
jgi:hypothetical protein